MRFIHAADLHLDVSLMSFPLDKQQILRDERINNLRRLCEYARKNGINIIILAGDIYDTNTPQPDTVNAVVAIMEQYARIFFLVVPGNHDDKIWYSHPKPKTKNLLLFGSSWQGQRITVDGVQYSFLGCTTRKDVPIEDSLTALSRKTRNIVIMHGGFSDSANRIKKSSLANKNIDYLALGHLHEHQEGPISAHENGIWAYPGTLEAAGFDECGKKGFLVVDISATSVQTTFVPFARREFHRFELDLSHISEKEFLNAYRRKKEQILSHVRANDCLRIKFVNAQYNLAPYMPYMIDGNENIFFFNIEEASTNLSISQSAQLFTESFLVSSSYRFDGDMNVLASQPSLVGIFAASVLRDEELNDEQKRQVIAIGKSAIEGNAVAL